jgi:curved DNA-binding protein CbpA
MVLEADAAPADARQAEVVRVLQVLRSAAQEAAAAPAAAGPTPPAAAPAPNPYAILGVDQAADSASIRKAYWKLSLLVHPDKCSHPAAQEVFTAVSKAAQLLQDSEQRQQFDAAAEDSQLRRAALAAAEAAEREVAWKRARGEAVPAELAAAVAAARAAGAGPIQRDDWMTQLPTQQQRTAASALAAGLSQVQQDGSWSGVDGVS